MPRSKSRTKACVERAKKSKKAPRQDKSMQMYLRVNFPGEYLEMQCYIDNRSRNKKRPVICRLTCQKGPSFYTGLRIADIMNEVMLFKTIDEAVLWSCENSVHSHACDRCQPYSKTKTSKEGYVLKILMKMAMDPKVRQEDASAYVGRSKHYASKTFAEVLGVGYREVQRQITAALNSSENYVTTLKARFQLLLRQLLVFQKVWQMAPLELAQYIDRDELPAPAPAKSAPSPGSTTVPGLCHTEPNSEPETPEFTPLSEPHPEDTYEHILWELGVETAYAAVPTSNPELENFHLENEVFLSPDQYGCDNIGLTKMADGKHNWALLGYRYL